MIRVTVPTLLWVLPMLLANVLGLAWAVFSVVDLGLRRLEFRVQQRLEGAER